MLEALKLKLQSRREVSKG